MIQIGYSDVGTIDVKSNSSVLQVSKGGLLIFNGKTHIGAGSSLSVGQNGILSYGDNVCCSGKSQFIAHDRIEIKDNCLISWNCIFMDTDFHKIIKEGVIINNPSKIQIEKNCWIGCNCTVLKGGSLPKNSILGAGSLLNKSFEESSCIYAGNPAKLCSKNISWER